MRSSQTLLLLSTAILATAALPVQATPVDTRIGAATAATFEKCIKAVWPLASLRNHEHGSVTLAYRLDAEGKLAESRVEKSSGFPLLDMAAREGIAGCKFSLDIVDATAQQTWKALTYTWPAPPRPAATAEHWRAATEGAERGEAKAEFDLAMVYLNGEERLRKPSEAMRLLKLSADKNYLEAQALLGRLASNGKFGPANPALALEMNTKAAEQGDARAQQTLGYMLGSGRLVPKDRDKAIDWLHQSYSGGLNSSATVLGILLIERAATPEEVAEGVRMLQIGDGAHDALASYRLGRCYEYGRGAPQDYVKAAALYTKATISRNKHAFLALANLYEHGRGVAPDPEKARQLREEANKEIAPRP